VIHKFYKDEQGWFIDLPEFIELGLGTKANLAMVCGADTFLDKLSNNGNEVSVIISEDKFEEADGFLENIGFNSPIEELEAVGHPIQYGGDYVDYATSHELWLCPVTLYIFGGHYPETIYYKVINGKAQ
jgi:hypothetical protein